MEKVNSNLQAPTYESDVTRQLPPPENKHFYPALDGLRAVAVIMVFVEHYAANTHHRLNWGWAGVDIFFVLSGFLITGILYDTREKPRRYRVFYVRRTLRIFPLYYGVLLVAFLITPLMHWIWNPAWLLWTLYLGNYARFIYINSPLLPIGAIEHLVSRPHGSVDLVYYLGHFWSLCVEEQFYLVWPLVVFHIRQRETLIKLCLWVIPSVLLARIACVWVLPPQYLAYEVLYRVTPLRIDALLIGGLAALWVRGPEKSSVLRAAVPVFWTLAVCFIAFEAFYGTLSGTHQYYNPYPGAPILDTVGFTLIDVFAAALILNLLSLQHPVARFLNLGPLRSLGRISYGFYVYHDIFHNLCGRTTHHFLAATHPHLVGPATTSLAFVLTLCLAKLSFRYFETPFLRLKSRFTV